MASVLHSLMHLVLLPMVLLTACAVVPACDDKAGASVAPVTIAGKKFLLEIAADDPTRLKGMGGRTHIEEDGGMIFVFTQSVPLAFVMRDCPIPIDILYLDGSGRVVAMHNMTPEEPRRANESQSQYESRLKQWPSRYPAQMVVEIRGGRTQELGVKEGDQLKLDASKLKGMAR